MYGLTLSILSLRHTISLSERGRKAVLLSSRTRPGKRRIASSASPASRVPAAKNLASASRSATSHPHGASPVPPDLSPHDCPLEATSLATRGEFLRLGTSTGID